MIDTFGRKITYLRLSVTEKCNLRCRYCMPTAGECGKSRGPLLTEEEMLLAVEAAASLGVTKVRVTGGEPLTKTNILSICRGVAATPGIAETDITTNGIRLPGLAPGIPEAMRAESMKITPHACLSRETAGIRGGTLIINLPGSKKASTENFSAVIQPVRHGVEMLQSQGSADCAPRAARILAVNISEQKGTQKHPVEKIELKVDHGIVGDAHAGNWHRQVSLLGIESVRKAQAHIDFALQPGDFAENILTEGLPLYELPVGAKIKIGTALCEVTQIGKECHFNCAIREKAGDCVMPREGIFAKVLSPGTAKAGDWVTVL